MDDTGIVLSRHKLDVDDYYRMAEAGILSEDDRVELIDGEIIDMAPIGTGHASVVNRLTEALVLAFTGKAIVSPQNPLRIDHLNEPQPDFVVFRWRADYYETERPALTDALLVVEVSDSSLRFDRAVKLPMYASAGIAEVWIVDLKHRKLDVHRAPELGRYTQVRAYAPGDKLTLAMAPDVEIRVEQVFG